MLLAKGWTDFRGLHSTDFEVLFHIDSENDQCSPLILKHTPESCFLGTVLVCGAEEVKSAKVLLCSGAEHLALGEPVQSFFFFLPEIKCK